MKFKTSLILCGATALAGYMLYEYGLSLEAKNAVENAARSLKGSFDQLRRIVESMHVDVADSTLPNVERTNNESAKIGRAHV